METNYCAELIDAINSEKSERAKRESQKIKDCIKFRLPPNGLLFDRMDGVNFTSYFKKYTNGVIELPFDNVAIEYPFDWDEDSAYIGDDKITKVVIVLSYVEISKNLKTILETESNTAIQGIVYIFNSKTKEWCAINGKFLTQRGMCHQNRFVAIDLDMDVETFSSSRMALEKSKSLSLELSHDFSVFSQFICALSCSNITTTISNPSKLKNTMRSRKGKQPFFSYKTLVIDTVKNHAQSHIDSKVRGNMRVHMRRGHIRKLKNKTVWINSCVVGDKNNGIIMNDYKVI